jgi:hypothetical protein
MSHTSENQQPPPPPHARPNKKIIVGLIAIALIIVVIVVLLMNPFAPAKSWRFFDSLSGNGNDESSVFTINNLWRVKWQWENISSLGVYGVFSVWVYYRSSLSWDPFAGSTTDGTRSSGNFTSGYFDINYTSRSLGSFYLRVIANNWVSWNMTVEEYR